ncbi:hypothetical protein ACTXT7_017071, partial [Hymenolepis weldensis]
VKSVNSLFRLLSVTLLRCVTLLLHFQLPPPTALCLLPNPSSTVVHCTSAHTVLLISGKAFNKNTNGELEK